MTEDYKRLYPDLKTETEEQKQSRMEQESDEYWAAVKYLDDLRVPTHSPTGLKYSLVGRIGQFKKGW